MSDLEQPKMTPKRYLVIASLLFGLFFGAGNLIFPIHLGQMTGENWLLATLGFLSTSVVMPLLAILAISRTHSDGVGGLGLDFGPKFAVAFMVLVQTTIGPMYAAPRVATVSFSVGLAPLLPKSIQPMSLLIYSLIFFVVAFYFSYKRSTIIDTIGKIMNPIFLILLAIIFVFVFFWPMGQPSEQVGDVAYASNTYFKGFLEGYNTVDMLGGLVFGGAVITAVRGLGFKKDNEVAKITSISGLITMSLVGLIYIGLILMGAMSLGIMKPAAEGGTALVQVVHHYMGQPGQILLAAVIILACLTTGIGLLTSFSEDLNRSFPKLSYTTWLAIATTTSFLIANIGLEKLIQWSLPVLMFLYPIGIVLILLGLTVYGSKYSHSVYIWTVSFTIIPAIFDFVLYMPKMISQSAFGLKMAEIQNYLPFASVGLGWLVPALIGMAVGFVAFHAKQVKK